MFFKKRKKKKVKDTPDADNAKRRQGVVVSTKAHPNRPGRGTLPRQYASLSRRRPRSPGYLHQAPGAPKLQPSDYTPRVSSSDEMRAQEGWAHHGPTMNTKMSYDEDSFRGKPTLREPIREKTFYPPTPPPLLIGKVTPRPGMESAYWEPTGSHAYPSGVRTDIENTNMRGPVRPRSAEDIRQWLSWRMKINDQLSSFVQRLPDKSVAQRQIPVRELPGSMTPDTLHSILSHADREELPSTSLDRFSYMIYGLPRVRCGSKKPLKKTKSTRSRSGSYRALRRKFSTKKAINTHVNNTDSYEPFYEHSCRRYPDTSSLEETLDFSDDCGWTDASNALDDIVPSYSLENARSALHEELLARGRARHESGRASGQNQSDRCDPSRQASHRRSAPLKLAREESMQYINVHYDPERSRLRSRQPSFKPAGGVPTILSLQNLPNQAQVPLRHVRSNHSANS